jgi:Zn-dependent peptidase ImmA (M78 family)/transcriptional regulator with XRE-family HTH domain
MSDLGDVLETARRAQGLRQAEVADAVGITAVALSRYENGLRTPGKDTLPELARVLGVTVDLLEHAGRARSGMAMDAHMRRRATAPATVWKQLEARLNMCRWHVGRLFESIAMHTEANVPRLDPIDHDPVAAARIVRMQWHMPAGPVRQLTPWLEAAGCVVVTRDFQNRRVDGLSQWAGPVPVMLINEAMPTDRRRLTMAHELAHLVLHNSDMGPDDDVEDQANEFAAEFLMPTDFIRPALRNLKAAQLPGLKAQYGVSMQAIVERAFRFGYLTPTQRTSMYKLFSARGWRTSEPGSDALPAELPRLLATVARDLMAAGHTAADIAAIAGYASAEKNTLLPTGRPTGHLRAL